MKKLIITLVFSYSFYCLASTFTIVAPEGNKIKSTGQAAGLTIVSDGANNMSFTAAGSGTVSSTAGLGASPNSAGLSISGANINLQPASASFPGAVTASGTQTFGGNKIMGGNFATTAVRLTVNPVNYTVPDGVNQVILDIAATEGLGIGITLPPNPTDGMDLCLRTVSDLNSHLYLSNNVGQTISDPATGTGVTIFKNADLCWTWNSAAATWYRSVPAVGVSRVTTISAVGPDSNGLGISTSGTTLFLKAANRQFGGALTPFNVDQQIGGKKNFSGPVLIKVPVSPFAFITPNSQLDIMGGVSSSSFQMYNDSSGESASDGVKFSFDGANLTVNNQELGSVTIRNLGGSLNFETDSVTQVTVAGGGHTIETPIDADISYFLSNLGLPAGGSLTLRSVTGTLDLENTSALGFRLVGGNVEVTSGSVKISQVGSGLAIAEGADARQDTCTLAAGSCTITNASVVATDRIYCTSQADGGVPGFLRISSRIVNTSYVVTSGSALDTSDIACLLVGAN